MAKKELTFEASMERLEEVVRILEGGNESLDGALKLYQEGINLILVCNEKLDGAEKTVKMLQLQPDGKAKLVDFGGKEVDREGMETT